MQQKEQLNKKLTNYHKLNADYNNICEFLELGEQDADQEIISAALNDLTALNEQVAQAKLTSLMQQEADLNNCFLEIHPGAGGTESQDWAEMLLRMYLRFAEQQEFKTELLDEQKGDEAGIKSVTLKISGEYAHGWLKNESGVHRLVRISPFNSSGKRMTSFASVWVYPEITDNIAIEIQDKDLRVDTYRASGAGGQHVNKTDSAIRITHLPSNIVVQCQTSRSQHKNREAALKMLKSRLYELELRKKQEEQNALNANKTDISWGNQIRSYVLQPYQMVKDLRTNYEESDVNKVLDGNLINIITSLLSS